MMEQLKVSLSATEVEIARIIGGKRREISLRYERATRRDFTPSGIDNDIEAVAAEMCVAKALNIYPEWSPTKGEVPKFDLHWETRALDIKSTQYANGNLLIPNLRENCIYVLVRGKLPNYEVVGFIPGHLVKSKGQYLNQTYIPCWTIKAEQLYPLSFVRLVEAKQMEMELSR